MGESRQFYFWLDSQLRSQIRYLTWFILGKRSFWIQKLINDRSNVQNKNWNNGEIIWSTHEHAFAKMKQHSPYYYKIIFEPYHTQKTIFISQQKALIY